MHCPLRAALAFILGLASPVALAHGDVGPLPTPVEDVPAFDPSAEAGSDGVTVSWPVQDDAERYEVYVNADSEAVPTWRHVHGEVRVDEDSGTASFVDASPPEPRDGREVISYAVLALDASGNPVAEGRVATPATEEALGVGVLTSPTTLAVIGVVVIGVLVGVLVAASRRRPRRP